MMKKISQLRLMKIAFELNSPEIIAKKEQEKVNRKAAAEKKYMDMLNEKMFNDHEAIKQYIMSLSIEDKDGYFCNYNKKERSFYRSYGSYGYKLYVQVSYGKYYHIQKSHERYALLYAIPINKEINTIKIGEDK